MKKTLLTMAALMTFAGCGSTSSPSASTAASSTAASSASAEATDTVSSAFVTRTARTGDD